MFYPECLELKEFVIMDQSVVLNARLILCQLQVKYVDYQIETGMA